MNNIRVTWNETLVDERDWRRVVVSLNDIVIDVIAYRIDYRDFIFFYSRIDITEEEREEIEDFLIKYYVEDNNF